MMLRSARDGILSISCLIESEVQPSEDRTSAFPLYGLPLSLYDVDTAANDKHTAIIAKKLNDGS